MDTVPSAKTWPIGEGFQDARVKVGGSNWKVAVALTFFPMAAILHHAIFRPHTCMLNLLGNDYSFSAIAHWLWTNPSGWFALAAVMATYVLGSRSPGVRPWATGFLIAFLPLGVWIWDIPFTGQAVCRAFHDGRSGLRSWHFYLLGVGAYLPVVYLLTRGKLAVRSTARRSRGRSPNPTNAWYELPSNQGKISPERPTVGP